MFIATLVDVDYTMTMVIADGQIVKCDSYSEMLDYVKKDIERVKNLFTQYGYKDMVVLMNNKYEYTLYKAELSEVIAVWKIHEI